MCQLLNTLEEYKNVLFHADKSNNLSALVFFFSFFFFVLKHKALGAFSGTVDVAMRERCIVGQQHA